MTREEAIYELKNAAWLGTDHSRARTEEAVDMAIQALSQEPTISRLERRVDDNTVVFRTIDGEEVEYVRKEPCDDTVSIRKDVLKCRVGNIVAYNVEWLKKHWQMEMDIVCGIKPCDDAVSRDMALEKMADYVASGYADSVEDFEEYSRIICQLPSVTQKSGKWINKDFRKEEYVLTGKCSGCGQVRILDKFCSNCGAKMESEE